MSGAKDSACRECQDESSIIKLLIRPSGDSPRHLKGAAVDFHNLFRIDFPCNYSKGYPVFFLAETHTNFSKRQRDQGTNQGEYSIKMNIHTK